MKTKDYYKPLWTINLNPTKITFSAHEQLEAIDFLSKMNSEIRKATELYFNALEKTPETEQALKEVQEKCYQLDLWIDLAKKFLSFFSKNG